MLRTIAVMNNFELVKNVPLDKLQDPEIKWFWVDFDIPTEGEAIFLDTYFHFHPLAIEDCLHLLQRPKLDHYDDVHFFVLHAMNQKSLAAEEVDLFLGKNFVVSFHHKESKEVNEVWNRITEKNLIEKGPMFVAYLIMDKLVDYYFPSLYQIEDHLNEIESSIRDDSIQELMEEVFDIRSHLLKLRRTIFPMRDLLYRIINSDKVDGMKEQIVYFTDIYDHLLKLSEMIESNREMTADMRDSYISMNSNRMNTIMKTLTVMTAIFIPLTFIASIYGMNFEYMPELTWRWGYFGVLGIMLFVGSSLLIWFWRKGWYR
ncbi:MULTISPECIES: magnesium/cobalt transporter CorA [unclassified Paenibacillus]|uniref:Magnesium transport protein CorA n=1 Tax=Paenibacillus provencensis TaxID=441151 RepID=A0ABW3Q3C5_9BACL|nr:MULTISPECIES: magnesium/cobalt transporter CorA [unclassified Paenibacillus]MCM3131011.1 magnesium/cobalt transporter CorA [Paenibacillus sp. MER 78]SDX87593.1 magnesium transporter [Paenibacillus sp. PDC88]SGI71715.1 magnesium and cobalt transport transmembrane protein CorA [Mycobacterium tuberculosis]